MKKINVWCILVTVLFLLLGLSKVALASSQGKAKRIRMWKDWRKFQLIVSPSFARLI